MRPLVLVLVLAWAATSTTNAVAAELLDSSLQNAILGSAKATLALSTVFNRDRSLGAIAFFWVSKLAQLAASLPASGCHLESS